MLVLSRRSNQEVRFPTLDICVRVLKSRGTVKLGIEAPADVRILRDEVEDALAQLPAANDDISRLPQKARHELRNRLQSITIGLHLLREQMDRGLNAEAKKTMEVLIGHIQAANEHPTVAAPKSPARKLRSALLVEDEPNERELLAAFLKLQGYQVVTAGSGEEAIEQLERQTPDVVLLDLNLPDMRGEEILSRIRDEPQHERLPVYVVSGSDRNAMRGDGVVPNRFFQKPLNPQALIDAMNVETCA